MALGSIIGGLLKKKPDVPEVAPIDVGAEQKKALQANVSNYGLVQQLSDLANQTALQAGLGRIDALLGAGTRQQITDLISSGLKGELPKDITDLIQRRSAESAQARGVAGTGFSRNLELRDLGLTSLQRTQQALDTATRWLQTSASMVPQYDFGSMFINPSQAIAQANINQENMFQRDWLSNQLSAAFHPSSIIGEGLIKADDQIMSLISQVAGSYLGGMMGGMGGGGGSSMPQGMPSLNIPQYGGSAGYWQDKTFMGGY